MFEIVCFEHHPNIKTVVLVVHDNAERPTDIQAYSYNYEDNPEKKVHVGENKYHEGYFLEDNTKKLKIISCIEKFLLSKGVIL